MQEAPVTYVADNHWLSGRGYTPVLLVHGVWEKWFKTKDGTVRLVARVLQPVKEIINKELDLYRV